MLAPRSEVQAAVCLFLLVWLLIGLVMTFLTPKIYSAATTVKIDRVVPRILNTQMSGQPKVLSILDFGKPNFS